MATKASLENLKQNAELAEQIIADLKNELNILNQTYTNIQITMLKEENAKLLEAVDNAKKQLVNLEIQNNIKQVPVPKRNTHPPKEDTQRQTAPTDTSNVTNVENSESKSQKSKQKKEKPAKTSPAVAESAIDVGCLDLRVAKIEDVQKHPDADTLYMLKINCGEEKPRTVCSGLVKFMPMSELEGRDVILLCNLKPAKMRGITSEAMVMCASTPEKVEVLIPPFNCVPGELVECEGFVRRPDSVMNPKKKIFETVAPDLHVDDSLKACYKNVPLTVPGKGCILSKSLKNCNVK